MEYISSNGNDELIWLNDKTANMTIGEKIQEISTRLANVNEELHQQVGKNHSALLQQATHAGRFDDGLNALTNDVARIRTVGHKLTGQVSSLYQVVDNQTKVQARLHNLSHLLRSAGTLLSLTTKLNNTKDGLRQSAIHFELEQLIENKDIKGIEFIQNEHAYVISSRQKLRNLTQMQLVTGLKERNKVQVINALKIFMNFSTLEKSLENLLTTFISDLEQSLKECFAGTDISVLNKAEKIKLNNITSKAANNMKGPGKVPQLTTTQNYRAKFWKSLHWLIYDELFETTSQIKLLKECLEHINQTSYIQVKNEQAVEYRFWSKVQNLFHKSFAECPAHVSQALQEGLSKLLTSIRGLEQRLEGEFIFDSNIFLPLEVGYISKVSANMKACLAGVDLPSNETVDNFIRIAAIELSASLIDKRMADKIAAVFVSCGKDFCTKLEAQIKLGADSKQVVDLPNFQQMQNTLLANILFYYKDSVNRMLQDLGDHLEKSKTSVRENITKSLEEVNLLIITILQQIINSIISTVSIIILSMHREPGLHTEKISTTGPSLFVKELQEFLTRVWHHHISPFDDSIIVKKCGKELATRCIEMFIHNLSILRPLSKAGRQRLKNDCVHMESTLKIICPDLTDLGNNYRLLRAMSTLITQKPQELITQSVGKESLVPSYIVLFLLFGHAGVELQSPHTTANWSNERLIEWLNGHTNEREKLELISGALQRYRDNIRRRNSTKYDEVYPIIVEFFEHAVKEYS